MKGMVFLLATIFLTNDTATALHVTNSFEFMIAAPLNRAAPLFGPEGERCWAGKQWDPRFLYPQPGQDVTGAVFTVQHGPHTSVWVNTVFDAAAGRMQYVSFIPDTMVSTVDVRLAVVDSSTTQVSVTYARTALNGEANEHVRAMGAADRESGPEWQEAIAGCLAAQVKSGG